MASGSPIRADRLLRRCPSWPTMQWVSSSSVTRLSAKATLLRAHRPYASRQDVVGITVMYCAPEDPRGLWEILDPYLREIAKSQSHRQALMVKLPSPVSLRVDALVKRAREVQRAYRQDLIGALAMRTLPKRDRLVELFDLYHQAIAGEAAVDGVAKHAVLRRDPPKPGRRPLRDR